MCFERKCLLILASTDFPLYYLLLSFGKEFRMHRTMEFIIDNVDWKLAKKLRNEDPEQFYTLVRMHLSFVLDLNTEDCECPVEKDKLPQFLRRGLASFTRKGKSNAKGNSESAILTKEGIANVYQLVEYLKKDDNIIQEGIFRRSGKVTKQQELKSQLNQGVTLNLENGQYSVHECASVLKNFLADLSEPLLTETYFPAYCQIAELCIRNSEKTSEIRLQTALQLLLLLLPEENWLMLKDILAMLHLTASHEKQNKMSAENLATLFTPHLLCPRKLSPEALHSNAQMLSHVVSFMIRSGLELFQVPPTLATDIYAYWERRKLSSKVEVSESSAANTVFSFVDRERSAQENTTNPTEAALAQLYAYIQSLPESNKKRRLVKQFNKENGHGTPRHTNSKTCSLGDSIKKRIFNKGSKGLKPLYESNVMKNGRSGDGILESPEYKKSIPKVRLTFEKSIEEIESSLETSNSSGDKLLLNNHHSMDVTGGSDSDRKGSSSCEVLTENSGEPTSNLPVSDSYSPNGSLTGVDMVQSPVTVPTVVTSSTVTVTTTTVHVDHISSSTPENKLPFFTPPTPVSMRPHRYRTVSKTCSTPNAKQWTNSFLLTSTPACNNCLLSPSPMVASADDMSPITRSTQRMTKAMQETMMTPRSRKPVVALSGSNLCHLANLTWGVKEPSWPSEEVQDVNKKPPTSYEEDSLTSSFRDYLLSRSVLTTSPVDLSFSSRTGDFDPSSLSDILQSPLSDSLLHCMDGNPISSDSSSSGSRKRSAESLSTDQASGTSNDRSSDSRLNSESWSEGAVCETSL